MIVPEAHRRKVSQVIPDSFQTEHSSLPNISAHFTHKNFFNSIFKIFC